MQYFKDCKSMDDVKCLYRKLAKKLHPDQGGNENEMKELNRQYNEIIGSRFEKERLFREQAEYANKSSDWTEQQKEDWFQKGRKAWGEQFENKSYGGYGGYKYNNNANMRQEYYNQRIDPRIADYQRMKSQHESLKTAYQHVCNELNNVGILIKSLQTENEKMKKKVQTQKRQLDKLKNMPKPEKKRKLRPLKSSSIAL